MQRTIRLVNIAIILSVSLGAALVLFAAPPAQTTTATTLSTSTTEVLLLPSDTSGKLWHYTNGNWTTITPPQVGWYWYGINVNPSNPDWWLLIGNTTTPVTWMDGETGNVTAVGTTLSPLYLTTDAGLTWQPITLTGTQNEGSIGINALTWSDDGEGTWSIAGWAGNLSNPSGGWKSFFWHGQGANSGTPVITNDYAFTYLTAGLDGETIIADTAPPSSGKLVYHSLNGELHAPPGNAPRAWWGANPGIDRLPGQSPAVVGTNWADKSLWATDDYRIAQPTQRLQNVGGSIAATTHGIYAGWRSDGVLKISNVLTSPTTEVVVGSGQSISYVATDRQTRTAVVALRQDNTALYLLPEEDGSWQTIPTPSTSTSIAIVIKRVVSPTTPTATSTSTPTTTPTATPTTAPTATLPPNHCTISINGGARHTGRRTVSIRAIVEGAAMMMLSNDGGFDGAVWQPYTTETTWTLADPGPRITTLLVYARFRDTDGNPLCGGASVSDDIVYDPFPPSVIIIIIRPHGLQDPSPTSDATNAVVEVIGEDQNDGSGVAEMQLSTDATFQDALWQPFQPKTVLPLAPGQTLYVLLRDRAGNISATSSGMLIYTLQMPLLQTFHH